MTKPRDYVVYSERRFNVCSDQIATSKNHADKYFI